MPHTKAPAVRVAPALLRRIRLRVALAAVLPLALLAPNLPAQDAPPEGNVIRLEPFNVTAYSGNIRIIDGFTGKDYEGTNPVVVGFARSFNKLLLGFHKKLVHDEVRHLELRDQLGQDFEREMRELSASFGFRKFKLDHSTWLSRERSIITRLVREPFFKIDALVVWDLARLNEIAPAKPKSKFAADIRYDTASGRWERRVTTKWEVYFWRKDDGEFYTAKAQGLNLDTQQGYHFIDNGLPVEIPPTAFKNVSLTYPIFVSDQQTGKQEVVRLQELLIANLNSVYDPFSWVNRRNLRFRGGFAQDCLDHVQEQRLPIDDRKWFDPVFSRFLSDVITIKLQSEREIYSFHMQQKRLGESPRKLGVKLDLLNWNPGEDRAAKDLPEAAAALNVEHPTGFRYVLIDAYQRFGDAFVDQLRQRLKAPRAKGETLQGRALFTEAIEQLAQMPYADFARRAQQTQEARLNQFRATPPA